MPDFGNPELKNKWPGSHEAENPWGVTSASLEVSPRGEKAEKGAEALLVTVRWGGKVILEGFPEKVMPGMGVRNV